MNTFKQPVERVVCFWQLYNRFRNGDGRCPYVYDGETLRCKHASWHVMDNDCAIGIKRNGCGVCTAMSPICVTQGKFDGRKDGSEEEARCSEDEEEEEDTYGGEDYN